MKLEIASNTYYAVYKSNQTNDYEVSHSVTLTSNQYLKLKELYSDHIVGLTKSKDGTMMMVRKHTYAIVEYKGNGSDTIMLMAIPLKNTDIPRIKRSRSFNEWIYHINQFKLRNHDYETIGLICWEKHKTKTACNGYGSRHNADIGYQALELALYLECGINETQF